MDTALMKEMKELRTENARLKKMSKSGSKPNSDRKPRGKAIKPSHRKEMALKVVISDGVSIRLACVTFSISEICYRYQACLSVENDQIADWLLRSLGI